MTGEVTGGQMSHSHDYYCYLWKQINMSNPSSMFLKPKAFRVLVSLIILIFNPWDPQALALLLQLDLCLQQRTQPHCSPSILQPAEVRVTN